MVNLTTADIADSAGAQLILHAIRQRWSFIKHLFADGAYDRTKLMEKAELEAFFSLIDRPIGRSCRLCRSTSLVTSMGEAKIGAAL
jgi:Transposase DDE domain